MVMDSDDGFACIMKGSIKGKSGRPTYAHESESTGQAVRDESESKRKRSVGESKDVRGRVLGDGGSNERRGAGAVTGLGA